MVVRVRALLADVVLALVAREVALVSLTIHGVTLRTFRAPRVAIFDKVVAFATLMLSVLLEKVKLVEHQTRAIQLLGGAIF